MPALEFQSDWRIDSQIMTFFGLSFFAAFEMDGDWERDWGRNEHIVCHQASGSRTDHFSEEGQTFVFRNAASSIRDWKTYAEMLIQLLSTCIFFKTFLKLDTVD